MKTEELTALNEVPSADNKFKEYIINYVGEKKNPDNDEVTLEMVIDVIADEFPEFIMCISEENWIRGYRQALSDIEEGERLYHEELHKKQE